MKRYTKEVHKALSDPRFEVLKLLQDNHTVTEISNIRETTRRATYKLLSSLEEKGLIENIGGQKQKVYNITRKGLEGIHSFVGLKYNLRGHNIGFKIEVLGSSRNWDKKRQQLVRLPFFNKRIRLKNNEQHLFSYQKLEIKTTSKSVIIKLPEILSKNLEEAIIQAMDMLYDSLPKIERLFKIKLVKDYKANITIISQEWASLQDALAKLYRVENKKLYISDEEGKIWLIADYSFNVDELETILPETSDDDMDIVKKHMNDLRDNRPPTNSQLNNSVKDHDQVINKSMKVLEGYAEQIALHLEVEKRQLRVLELMEKKLK
jgi:DNA-binding PadR family transcriptional regulator